MLVWFAALAGSVSACVTMMRRKIPRSSPGT